MRSTRRRTHTQRQTHEQPILCETGVQATSHKRRAYPHGVLHAEVRAAAVHGKQLTAIVPSRVAERELAGIDRLCRRGTGRTGDKFDRVRVLTLQRERRSDLHCVLDPSWARMCAAQRCWVPGRCHRIIKFSTRHHPLAHSIIATCAMAAGPCAWPVRERQRCACGIRSRKVLLSISLFVCLAVDLLRTCGKWQ